MVPRKIRRDHPNRRWADDVEEWTGVKLTKAVKAQKVEAYGITLCMLSLHLQQERGTNDDDDDTGIYLMTRPFIMS